MTPAEGPSKHQQPLERLFFVLVVAVLAAAWAISIAYAVAERGRIIERAQSQLTLTVATLADFNEPEWLDDGDGAFGRSLRATDDR